MSVKSILVGLGLVFSFSVFAAEVVLTTPVETDLSNPDAQSTQKAWIEMIAAAKENLDIEQFYISDQKGESLEPVLDEVRAAAARGVKVRILADAKFAKTYPDSLTSLGELKNIETRTIDMSPGVQHAKFFIVDGSSFYLGSANFDWRALSHIHELGIRLDDANLATSLGAVFDIDWAKGKTFGTTKLPTTVARKVVKSGKSGEFKLVGSPEASLPKGLKFSLTEIVALLRAAKTSKDTIDLQTMDYSTQVYKQPKETWKVLDDELKAAAKRGVQVRILVENDKVAKNIRELRSLSQTSNIQVKRVLLPEAKQGHIDFARLIHSKYLVINGKKAWVGTDNWSKDYFTQSRGVGLITDSTQTVSTLQSIYNQLWESNYTFVVK